MTYLTFFACLFTAYGPPAIVYYHKVSNSFVWLVSVLISGAIWFGSQSDPASTIFYSVLWQEVVRIGYLELLRRAEVGLQDASDKEVTSENVRQELRNGYALASGFGFGFGVSLISFVSLLSNSVGPGNLFREGCPQVSAIYIQSLMALLNCFLNVLYMLVAYQAYTFQNVLQYATVLLTHYAVAYSSIPSNMPGSCSIPILVPALVLVGLLAFYQNIKK